jgi:hypothetical protein
VRPRRRPHDTYAAAPPPLALPHRCRRRRRTRSQRHPAAAAHRRRAGRAAALSGPAEFWRSRQRANGGTKLLAPIRVAQRRLADVAASLDAAGGAPTREAVTDALQALRASSLNCYVFEALPDDSFETRTSLATQSLGLADPCTLRLVLKNVTSLEGPAVRAQAAGVMGDAVAAFERADAALSDARATGGAAALASAKAGVAAARAAVDGVEALVMDVLASP